MFLGEKNALWFDEKEVSKRSGAIVAVSGLVLLVLCMLLGQKESILTR